MATASVSTPIKSHRGLFSSRTAGGRMPLTPSPRQSSTTAAAPVNHGSSPFSPDNRGANECRVASITSHGGNLLSRLRESPKSNIARDAQTPRKALELGVSDFTLVGTGKTPSSSKSKKRPLRQKSTKTTLSYGGDRFIPNRGSSGNSGSSKMGLRNMSGENSTILSAAAEDAAAALDRLNINDDGAENYARPSPNTAAYQDSLADACGVNLSTRILEFKPAPPESSKPIDLRQQYNRPLKPAGASSAQLRRRIPTAPERVLDAPGLIDDYYLNLLDWSSENQVAVGLERNVYVWSANEGSVSCLSESPADTYVSSVKWAEDGYYMSIGLGTGEVQIWDVVKGIKVRSMYGHDTRVGVVGWSKHLLSSGARSGLVFNHDVRVKEHKVAELVSHTSEVCGLEWRADGQQLATGGNDNLVSIWDARSLSVPKFTKTNHKAAVKALAWCPWNMHLLATGGGAYDRHIHFWNSSSGARVNSIDTGSQVTSLRWSQHYREIVSSSGFPTNSLSIWSYPTLVRTAELTAHDSRVLHSCLSPDGQMLATAAADESLKFWKLFERKAGAAGGLSGVAASSKTADRTKQMTIR
ncbi:hypothetical protein CP532_4569 [Ophiocordyceps camponoti-leonardi (nom. inval.)]|nr:hypothetical protein CP532_4569 [Ophiocordyceps camponoti-leonardi (nom. inval.)]